MASSVMAQISTNNDPSRIFDFESTQSLTKPPRSRKQKAPKDKPTIWDDDFEYSPCIMIDPSFDKITHSVTSCLDSPCFPMFIVILEILSAFVNVFGGGVI